MAMPTRPSSSSFFSPKIQHTSRAMSSTSYTAAPARNVTAIIHSPERSAMLCRYPSKLCDMLRSEKRGGGLHRFCAYHRERANINQRRVDHRRRLRKKGLPVPPLERAPSHWQTSEDTHSESSQPHVDVKREERQVEDQIMRAAPDVDLFESSESIPPLLPDFSDTDLQELMFLLDDVETQPALFSIKEEHTAEDTRV